MLLTAVLTVAEEGGFIALNPETGTTTQGETITEAVLNLKEATSLYLEEFSWEPRLPYEGYRHNTLPGIRATALLSLWV